jgi:hypothetical protein
VKGRDIMIGAGYSAREKKLQGKKKQPVIVGILQEKKRVGRNTKVQWYV